MPSSSVGRNFEGGSLGRKSLDNPKRGSGGEASGRQRPWGSGA